MGLTPPCSALLVLDRLCSAFLSPAQSRSTLLGFTWPYWHAYTLFEPMLLFLMFPTALHTQSIADGSLAAEMKKHPNLIYLIKIVMDLKTN
jgi:hypothetical protein